MNSRERLTAILFGTIFTAVCGWYLFSSVGGWFSSREERLEKLSRDVKKKKLDLLLAQKAAERLSDYQLRSLPPDAELAKSLYQRWLLNTLEGAGWNNVNVAASSVRPMKDAYRRLGFTVTAEADLEQLLAFLEKFESQSMLHRIDSLNAKPNRNSKLLTVGLTIGALSVNSAAKSDQLPETPHDPQLLAELTNERETILQRNFFSPPNQIPKLEISSSARAYPGKGIDLTAKAGDPDPLDQVSFTLAKNTEPPAVIDRKSGRISWTPREKGEYSLEIVATDDSWPRGIAKKTVSISVVDPPPPPPPAPPPEVKPMKLAFDAAKYTVLSGVVSIGEEAEAWLLIRPEGRTLKVRTGDRFEIGSLKATVVEIELDALIFEADGKMRRLDKGGILLESSIVVDSSP